MTSATMITQPVIQPVRATERAGDPGEARAAVRVDVVQRLVRVRDEQHRDEREQDRDRRPVAHLADDAAERGGEAVGRGGRGDRDDDAGDQAERADLEAL